MSAIGIILLILGSLLFGFAGCGIVEAPDNTVPAIATMDAAVTEFGTVTRDITGFTLGKP